MKKFISCMLAIASLSSICTFSYATRDKTITLSSRTYKDLKKPVSRNTKQYNIKLTGDRIEHIAWGETTVSEDGKKIVGHHGGHLIEAVRRLDDYMGTKYPKATTTVERKLANSTYFFTYFCQNSGNYLANEKIIPAVEKFIKESSDDEFNDAIKKGVFDTESYGDAIGTDRGTERKNCTRMRIAIKKDGNTINILSCYPVE